MPDGYHGKILRVDLSSGKLTTQEVDTATYRRYLGGGALASYFLLKEMAPGTEPFSPENKIAFMTSIINGTPLSGLNRFSIASKSPLTGGFGETEAGGWWGPELKTAGFDGVIAEGKSPEPVYLWIHDGEAELRKAGHIWGKLSGEVQDTTLF